MGFNQFFDYKEMGYGSFYWGLPEKKMFDFMLGHIKKEKQPFCFYSVTMSTHAPFESYKNFIPTESTMTLKTPLLKYVY